MDQLNFGQIKPPGGGFQQLDPFGQGFYQFNPGFGGPPPPGATPGIATPKEQKEFEEMMEKYNKNKSQQNFEKLLEDTGKEQFDNGG